MHKVEVEVAVEVGEALERTVAGCMVVQVAAVEVVVEVEEAAVEEHTVPAHMGLAGDYDSFQKTLDLHKASSL